MKNGVLPQNDSNNGWLNILEDLQPANVLATDEYVNFAVIGGGLTGLATARRLAELNPDCRVALVDGGRIGNNASGRCSGFAIDQAHNIRASNFSGALDNERRELSLNRVGQNYLRDVVEKHSIQCDWDERGKIHAARTVRGEKLLGSTPIKSCLTA